MQKQKWEKLNRAFDYAVDLPEEAQVTYLAKLQLEDRELHEQLQALLNSEKRSARLISDPIDHVINELLNSDETWYGRKFGAFKVTKKIATGGMGSVFLGERINSDFEQQVAIKVLQTVLANEDTIGYFENERKILATLNHPNIAKLFDGGTTNEGLPYLVMEFIDGCPINEYCDKNNFNIKQRIALFLYVCSAVEHSHRNLIVHRDIKPSNILVSTNGVPKLLDFGIAKEIISSLSDNENTILGKQILTPAYASPEQVRGEPITTATDVYSLGVLLYQLLTGRMPYELNQTSPVEIISSICDLQPTAPSVFNLRFAKEMKGDLDSIVLYALNKEPERRYLSVRDFSNDINAWLNGRPVIARGNGSFYKFTKFIKKNLISVTASVTLFISSIVFSIYSYQQAEEIKKERDTAERVTEFISSIFTKTNPNNNGEKITASELLISSKDRLDREFVHLPEVKLRLQSIMAWSFLNMGEYDYLDKILVDAIPLSEITEAAAETRLSLYRSQAVANKKQNKYAESLTAFQKALTIAESELNGTELHSFILSGMADVNSKLAKYNEAIQYYLQSLALLDALQQDKSLAYQPEQLERLPIWRADIRHNLAIVLYLQGKYNEALDIEKQVLDILLNQLDEETPRLANVYNFTGSLYKAVEHDDVRALQFYLKSLAINEKILGTEHINVAHNLSDIALLRIDLGDIKSAIDDLQRSYTIFVNQLGEDSYEASRISLFIAREKIKQRAFNGIEEILMKASAVFNRTIPEGHDGMILLLEVKALYLVTQNKTDEAQTQLLKANEIIEHLYGSSHTKSVDIKIWLSRNYIALGKHTLAKSFLDLIKSLPNSLEANDKRNLEVEALYDSLPPY